jgi:hypothetical protein
MSWLDGPSETVSIELRVDIFFNVRKEGKTELEKLPFFFSG